MSMPKNKYDIVQYTLRLNLNNPDHVIIHKTLQGLNKNLYKSQNSFIADAIKYYTTRYSDEELLSERALEYKRQNSCITRQEYEEDMKRLHDNIMQELSTLLIAALAKRN